MNSTKARLADEEDVLGWLYERIVSGRNRRRLGTFFTPKGLVTYMLQLDSSGFVPARVVDAGAGVGAFTLAASSRWPQAAIVGIDLNVVTLGLLATRSSVLGAEVELVHGDFLRWLPADAPGASRLMLGNPPYTRHQGLDGKLKDRAIEAAGGLVSSRLAGVSTYFLASMLTNLSPSDAICVLLPGNWTEARYGRELRDHLWSLHRDVTITSFGTDEEVFPGTRVTATVAWIGPEVASSEMGTFTLCRASLEDGEVVEGERTVLTPRRSCGLPSLGPLLWPRARSHTAGVVALGRFAKVRRGVATGANDFFFLDDEVKNALPPEATVRAIRRLRHAPAQTLDLASHDELKGVERRWLLWLQDDSLHSDPAVLRYLATASQELRGRELLRRRGEKWFVVECIEAPSVLVSTSARGHLRAVNNACGTIPSNSMYGIYLPEEVSAERFTTWWNSDAGQLSVLANVRHYANGLLKLEPSDVVSIAVPQSVINDDA